jgi:hypothetical protein
VRTKNGSPWLWEIVFPGVPVAGKLSAGAWQWPPEPQRGVAPSDVRSAVKKTADLNARPARPGVCGGCATDGLGVCTHRPLMVFGGSVAGLMSDDRPAGRAVHTGAAPAIPS